MSRSTPHPKLLETLHWKFLAFCWHRFDVEFQLSAFVRCSWCTKHDSESEATISSVPASPRNGPLWRTESPLWRAEGLLYSRAKWPAIRAKLQQTRVCERSAYEKRKNMPYIRPGLSVSWGLPAYDKNLPYKAFGIECFLGSPP